MGKDFKDNWKRLANKRPPVTIPTAMEDKDILRFEDLAALGFVSGSGVYRVTELFGPGPQVARGGSEPIFELIIIRESGSFDAVLPFNPIQGKRYEIKDGAGDGCLPGVTKRILPSGSNTIEDIFTEFPLSNCYQSWSLIFDGSGIWRLV